MMPDASVQMALCLGPFEDDLGVASFFEGTRPRMNPAACAKQLRRDLLTGVATALRAVELHKPHLILGLSQGGIIALAVGRPLVVEFAMWARNVQPEESVLMASAWKAAKGCVAVQPRPGKARFSPDALLKAVPEWKVSFHIKDIPSVAVSPLRARRLTQNTCSAPRSVSCGE